MSNTSEPILTVRQLNIQHEIEFHRSDTVRDFFVGMVNNPLRIMLGNKDVFHVVKDFDLTLHRGERLGIIGVNGVGKTSLCRAIAGMLYPASGEVIVKGEVRAIFDTSVGIQPELTGRENAVLLSRFLFPHVPSQELQAVVEESLEFSELGKFIDTPFKSYSKGMQSRLCLSLITGRPTDLLILDEVFDGADYFFQQKISARTLQMIENSGAVILVSHTPSQLERACNRVIVLGEGGALFDGGVAEAVDYYHASGQGHADK